MILSTKIHLFCATLDLCQPFLVFLHTSRQKRNGHTIKRDSKRRCKLPLSGNILIREEYPKGAIALNEGEVAHEIVFVGKGMLRQYYYKNGKDVTEHFSYEGCIVMCIESFLKQVPTKLIVETLEPVVLYMFPRDMLFKLAKENWEINMFYQKILEYSLIVSQIKADSWRFESARERYNLLLETHPEIIKRAPLAHIASYLLMTPETLSRVRSGVL